MNDKQLLQDEINLLRKMREGDTEERANYVEELATGEITADYAEHLIDLCDSCILMYTEGIDALESGITATEYIEQFNHLVDITEFDKKLTLK